MLSGLLPITKTSNLHVYFGISPQAWLVRVGCASPSPGFNCTNKEAEDRITLHVQDILSHQSGPTSMTRSMGDTVVFLCLLYCITVGWKYLGIQELWLICNSGMRRSILPLYDIHVCTSMGDKLTQCLPALHTLPGCDTTNNISIKLAAINESYISTILYLWSTTLTVRRWQSMMQMTETFLVKCLKLTIDLETFNILWQCPQKGFWANPFSSVNARKHKQHILNNTCGY